MTDIEEILFSEDNVPLCNHAWMCFSRSNNSLCWIHAILQKHPAIVILLAFAEPFPFSELSQTRYRIRTLPTQTDPWCCWLHMISIAVCFSLCVKVLYAEGRKPLGVPKGYDAPIVISRGLSMIDRGSEVLTVLFNRAWTDIQNEHPIVVV